MLNSQSASRNTCTNQSGNSPNLTPASPTQGQSQPNSSSNSNSTGMALCTVAAFYDSRTSSKK